MMLKLSLLFTLALANDSRMLDRTMGALPAGNLSRVLARTMGVLPPGNLNVDPYTAFAAYVSRSYTVTPATTGLYWVGFAFRHDPAFWYFTEPSLVDTAATSTQLLTNANLATSYLSSYRKTDGTTMSITLPTAWNIFYEGSVIPSAAGRWETGVWIDGAVGSFDGIYQCVGLTAGRTYTLSFKIRSNNNADGNLVQLGAYVTKTLFDTECTAPSALEFTIVQTSPAPTPSTLPSRSTNPTQSALITAVTSSSARPTQTALLSAVASSSARISETPLPTFLTTPTATRICYPPPTPCPAQALALDVKGTEAVVATVSTFALMALLGIGVIVGAIGFASVRAAVLICLKRRSSKVVVVDDHDSKPVEGDLEAQKEVAAHKDDDRIAIMAAEKMQAAELAALREKLALAEQQRDQAGAEFLGLRNEVTQAKGATDEALAAADKLRAELATAEKAKANAEANADRILREASERAASITAAAEEAKRRHEEEAAQRAEKLKAQLEESRKEAEAQRAAGQAEMEDFNKMKDALSAAKMAADALRADAEKTLSEALDKAHRDMEKALEEAKKEAADALEKAAKEKDQAAHDKAVSDHEWEVRLEAASNDGTVAHAELSTIHAEVDRLRKENSEQQHEIETLKELLAKANADALTFTKCETISVTPTVHDSHELTRPPPAPTARPIQMQIPRTKRLPGEKRRRLRTPKSRS
jgi:hypothetical protein